LTPWNEPQRITVTPDGPEFVEVGFFLLEEGEDTIWFKLTHIPSDDQCQWPWSYGLLTWVSAEGRELGTVKVFGDCEGEVFRLGVGRPPVERSGRVLFYPRSYNLAWIRRGNPWTIDIQASAGTSSNGSGNGSGGDQPGSTLGSVGDLVGAGASWAIENGYARILLEAN